MTKQHSRDEAEILAVLEGLREAHHNKSAAAIVATYSRDAIICDLAPPLAHRGVDAAAKQAWLDTWEGPVALEPRDTTVTVSGDIAIAQGFIRMSGKPKAAPQQLLGPRHDLSQPRARRLENRPSPFLGAVLHGRQPAAGFRPQPLMPAAAEEATTHLAAATAKGMLPIRHIRLLC